MKCYEKLYVVTHRGLSPGLQTAQVCHAAFAFAHQHRQVSSQWFVDSNWLVVLSVADEAELSALATRIQRHPRIPVSVFHEPDLGESLTAIAVAPSALTESLLGALPLALREFAGITV